MRGLLGIEEILWVFFIVLCFFESSCFLRGVEADEIERVVLGLEVSCSFLFYLWVFVGFFGFFYLVGLFVRINFMEFGFEIILRSFWN